MSLSILEFKKQLDNLLLEGKGSVSSDDVIDAINNKYRVIINYDDEKENAPTGTRLIEPYVLGLTNAGNQAIRSFQYYGSTRRGVPKYKLFRLDRILNWNPQPNNHFYADPKKLAVVAPDYNEDGDGSMSVVLAQVKFNNKREEDNNPQERDSEEWQSPLEKIKKQREKQNQDIDRVINQQPDREGAISTKGLNTELNPDGNKEDNNTSVNQTQNPRGAIKINPTIYDRDNKTQQQKQDADVVRKREDRWKKAVDSRPLYRKDSLNNDLKQFSNINDRKVDNTNDLKQSLNQALNIKDDEEEIENNI